MRYEGYVARYMGDGMLVYFGYPGAHENDAARAIDAALEIIATLDRSGRESIASNGHGFPCASVSPLALWSSVTWCGRAHWKRLP